MSEAILGAQEAQSIGIKEATAAAIAFLRDASTNVEIRNVLLEEVDSSDDDVHWLITLGFDVPIEGAVFVLAPQTRRQYKVFEVRKADGRVKSMKIRSVATI
ncbi:MAG TPA: hypothetical protein VF707_10835 [Ardenticatenaceae bacterium]|jgi:hypothetical protein